MWMWNVKTRGWGWSVRVREGLARGSGCCWKSSTDLVSIVIWNDTYFDLTIRRQSLPEWSLCKQLVSVLFQHDHIGLFTDRWQQWTSTLASVCLITYLYWSLVLWAMCVDAQWAVSWKQTGYSSLTFWNFGSGSWFVRGVACWCKKYIFFICIFPSKCLTTSSHELHVVSIIYWRSLSMLFSNANQLLLCSKSSYCLSTI